MGSTGKTWKEAASVILLAGTKGSRNPGRNLHRISQSSTVPRVFDYRVLLLTRNFRGSSAGAHVFPGGAIDKADFSKSWLELFAEAGVSRDFGTLSSIKGPRPPMLVADRQLPVPNDIAFRICAIREAFEESGVLLVKKFPKYLYTTTKEDKYSSHLPQASTKETVPYGSVLSDDLPSDLLKTWRQRVHKDASQFVTLCKELRCVPDVWALAEWTNWLTPAGNPRRYDTMFYTCCLENVPHVDHDKSEMIQSQWAHPEEAIQLFCDGRINLIGPQLFELLRIARFPMLHDLHNFISRRAFLGCHRNCPKRYSMQDGAISVYEGDDLYPSESSTDEASIASLEIRGHLEETIDYSRNHCHNLNRMEFHESMSLRDYQCTIPMSCGHVTPRSLKEFQTTPKL
ncbi:acyl-coenzyme A diphosphatase NUDT19-like [Amphiura filiformis]|uniref:acyl-coenzyme A diphosphatase NUDT19-like n=1 Tax=Amphiura filiformis TaxID=82378 RepID=UPI003B2224E6